MLVIFILPPLPRRSSERPFAPDGHAPAGARLRVVVPQRLVLDAPVVPEGDRVRLPTEPHLEFLARAELAQKVQDRAPLLSRQLVDVGGELAVDVERLAPGYGVGANNGMRGFRVDLAGLEDAHECIVPAIDV